VQVSTVSRARAGLPGTHRQRGFIAIVMLLLLVIGSLYLIVTGLSTAAEAGRRQQEDVTALALRQAKDALIARAALDDNRPGSLPCPDLDNDGDADLLFGNNCPSYIGRLPWRTLGLPDLRDAAGERLWYALSQNFTDSQGFRINSDVQGTLIVPGMAPAGGIVAIVFAPGTVVGAQQRGGAGGGSPNLTCAWGVHENCKVANYLEGQNASVDLTYEQSARCERTDCPGGVPFNDQLTVITHAELFAIVEPVVAKRIEKEIVPELTNDAAASGYFERWGLALYGDKQRGFFPFAAPYFDPAFTSPGDEPSRSFENYLGVYPQTNGLLPVTHDTDQSRVRWNAPSIVGDPDPPTLVQLTPDGTLTPFSPATCYTALSGYPECTFEYSCLAPTCSSLRVRFQARLRNVAESLVMNPDAFVDPTRWTLDGFAVPSYAPWSLSKTLVVAADGGLRVTFEATLPQTSVPPTRTVVIGFPTVAPSLSDITNEAAAGNALRWFVWNGWHRQTYYAVSDAFKPRADLGTRVVADACATAATPPPCINVASGPPKARAVLVLAGRHLGTGTRTYTIASYFEDENRINTPANPSELGTADYVFEQKLRSKTFNDRLVVVAVQP
jgi:hypothetical protein